MDEAMKLDANLLRVLPTALLIALTTLGKLTATEVATRPDSAATPPRFLIIAPQRFHEPLNEYARSKQQSFTVELTSLETALADKNPGDDPERLKRFIYDIWRKRELRYVLLVGDADVLPVRYMVLDRITPPAFDYAFYPSDLYYADLAKPDGRFEDWNARKDTFHGRYFGEVRGEKNKKDPINYDQIDYRPEIAVGRWPVSTLEEVRLLAKKSMTYEESLRAPDKDPRRAAFFVVGGWVDVRDRMSRIAARLPSTWVIDKRYYADKGATAATPPPDEKNVIDLLNSGVRLALHAGHGEDLHWNDSLTVNSIAKIHNAGHLPILLSAGCLTARFATLPPYEPYVDLEGRPHVGSDHGEVFTEPPLPPAPYQTGVYNRTSLGEQLLRAKPDGAVAYFGCNTGSQPCGMTLLEGFMDTFTRRADPRLGDCWAGAIAYYYEHETLARLKPNNDWYPPSIFFQGMKFMLFGDPTLPMPGRPPAPGSQPASPKLARE